jgi:alanine racemase
VALCLERAGADWFAVSNIEEAIQLRQCGVKIPVLILGYTPVECAQMLAENNISQCVYSSEYARELSAFASRSSCTVKIHVKLDTGMGRLGFQFDKGFSVAQEIAEVCALPSLDAEGIFTHFALSDMGKEGREFTREQYRRFSDTVKDVESLGVAFKYKHCANSAASVDYPELGLDMARVGIMLYGLLPSDKIENAPDLKPVMSLKTVVSYVKEIGIGTTISYGCDFVADRKMRVATVPMGYADGFWRSNSKTDIPLLIRGQKARILGRICMDQLVLDVSDIDGVQVGDEVTVFGDRDLVNTADDFARANGTINYEIICSVGKRVPRVFVYDGKVEGVHLGILDTTVN